MSNIGREVRIGGRIVGAVVEDMGKKLRIRLADGEPRNPVLGDFSIVSAKAVEFADVALVGYAAPATAREIDELARAGGDATLLRR